MNENRFEEEDLNDFLIELVQLNCLDNPALGITKLVISKGYKELSPKQQYVFKEGIDYHYTDKCVRCDNDIPWSEMSAAEDHEMCSWCAKLSEND
ncbi:hypothetical protein [Pedobacter sp. Leaf170]|uniref:hypothetical protein n=1 Tax=Pedobacter sp. Leaf170 TaxID=2876558 RepID=UPI001E2D5487|nr:hypothetical protein [Pedobacter sp. Leaf170]